MLKQSRVFLAAIACCAALLQPALAQAATVGDLGIKLGDDVATVKAALKTTAEPEDMPRNSNLPANLDPNKGKTVLHLRTKGVWAFFSAKGVLETIRLDAPFSGSVMGIKLGDSAQTVTTKLGKPIRKPFNGVSAAFAPTENYQYVLDDSAYVSFDINDDGVQYIFVNR